MVVIQPTFQFLASGLRDVFSTEMKKVCAGLPENYLERDENTVSSSPGLLDACQPLIPIGRKVLKSYCEDQTFRA